MQGRPGALEGPEREQTPRTEDGPPGGSRLESGWGPEIGHQSWSGGGRSPEAYMRGASSSQKSSVEKSAEPRRVPKGARRWGGRSPVSSEGCHRCDWEWAGPNGFADAGLASLVSFGSQRECCRSQTGAAACWGLCRIQESWKGLPEDCGRREADVSGSALELGPGRSLPLSPTVWPHHAREAWCWSATGAEAKRSFDPNPQKSVSLVAGWWGKPLSSCTRERRCAAGCWWGRWLPRPRGEGSGARGHAPSGPVPHSSVNYRPPARGGEAPAAQCAGARRRGKG